MYIWYHHDIDVSAIDEVELEHNPQLPRVKVSIFAVDG